MDIETFLRARLEEARDRVNAMSMEFFGIERKEFLALIESQMSLLDYHDQFIMMIEEPMEFDTLGGGDADSIVWKMTQKIEWATRAEYKKRFGSEAPTAPFVKAWAQNYSWHPDFQDEWLL